MEIALTIIGIVLMFFSIFMAVLWFIDTLEGIKKSLKNIEDSLHQFGDRTKAKDEKPVISVEY